ncbi:amidase family protein [Kitasatospora sp. NBC_01250]|uniref:amidase n=1 Tax=unclassified Kitasatospora TaxID=2633591 RepID=UPI002E135572|nr:MULTISPECIES: amidase family protein [unclassified Kitasatospora]WSJ66502.1 amidase family protein [Kitasatospora sp. NBC_01302]
MSSPESLRELDGHAQADLVRRGELTESELLRYAVERIERYDGRLGALAVTAFDQALAEAARAERAAGQRAKEGTKERTGPLHGVPFLLKDLGPTVAGLEATMGSRFLAGFTPRQGSELTDRFRSAGLRVLGKSRTAEFGVLPTTEPVAQGPTRNPWDPTRSAGGSSGGAAAAVAAGLVPVAHANDAGGSIRIPASNCGVFGLKPTRARTPLGPAVGDLMNGLAAEHVVSRSVRDSAAVLDAIAGPAPGDPYWAPPIAGRFAQAVRQGPDRPLRIAYTTRPGTGPLDPACATAVLDAAKLCADLGHQVGEAAPEVAFAELVDPFLVLWAAGVSSAITSYAQLSGRIPSADRFEELTWQLYQQGRTLSASQYLLAVGTLQRAARSIAGFYQSYDVLLSPVTAWPAPELGTFAIGSPDQQLMRAIEFCHETPLANLTGQPAMSVPLHWTEAGLPIGVHATGRFGDEATLFALAAELETAQPWADRLPALAHLRSES